MSFAEGAIKKIQDRIRAGQRRRRVLRLQNDPKVMAGVREGLDSERQGKGVKFEDLKRTDG